MKAILLDAFGEAGLFREGEVPLPEPKAKEVRIQVKSAGFNPVDFKIRKGFFGGTFPLILGADCSGVIDKVGEGVLDFHVGDEVYAMPFGPRSNGSYAQYLTVPSAFVGKKPKNLSFEEAAAVPLASLTAYRALLAPHAIQKGGSLFVAGAGGGVGSVAIHLAKPWVGNQIFTVSGSAESADFLSEHLGIPRGNIVLYKGKTLSELQSALTALNGGRLFSTTLDCVGGEMKKLCLELTAHSGHFSTLLAEEEKFVYSVWDRAATPCFNRNLSIHCVSVGAEGFSSSPEGWEIYKKQLADLTTLFEKGQLPPPHVKMLGTLSVETVKEAHRLLEEGRVKGKLVMRCSK